MRKLLTIAAAGTLAAFAATMSAAQEGAEASVNRSYDVSGFDEISVVGPHRVVISVGPAFSVRAEGPQKTFDDTEVEVEDGRLKIHPVDDERWERRWRDREWRDYWEDYRAATFHITLPSLEGVSLVGGGNMSVDRVEGAEFSASVAGSGDLDVAALRVGDARFSIAGSGDVDITGPASCSVTKMGSGEVSCAGGGGTD